jgi:threonyl-tRNA synthetase
MKSLKVIDLVLYLWLFRFENFTAQISLRDKENKEKYIGVMKTGRKLRALLSTLQQTKD